jgi:hypothetical protein
LTGLQEVFTLPVLRLIRHPAHNRHHGAKVISAFIVEKDSPSLKMAQNS